MKNRFLILLLAVLLILASACTPSQSPTAADKTGTPSISVVPSSSPTPTPQPTPATQPTDLIDEGDYAMFVGDYEEAYQTYRKTLAESLDPIITSKSNLGMGYALCMQGQYGPALDSLRTATASEDPITAGRAYYLLGKTYTALERYEEALSAYDAYLDLRPGLLDSHVIELQGDLFLALSDTQQAIQYYERAYQVTPEGGRELLAVKIASTYEQQGDLDTALLLYEQIFNDSINDYTKSQMDLLRGQILLSQGETEQAYALFQDAIENYPQTYDAYTALVILVNNEIPVNEYKRGLINYYVENYNLAIEAFKRYRLEGLDEYADAALYYQALATRALGVNNDSTYFEEAVSLWEKLLIDHPTSEYYIDAWQDIEFTLWAYLEEPQLAAETAITYVAQHPDSNEAPDFLFLAGRSYERANLLVEAADTWQRIADEYPNSDQTFLAIYFAGIAYVRLGEWQTALTLFDRALLLTSQPAEIAAAQLWIGKCQEAQGDISTALDSWKLAQEADPFGHYSIRAEDLLIDREPFTEPETLNLETDLFPYQIEAESWMRTTFNLPLDINLESPGLLGNDIRFQRGLEYWAFGLYEQAKSEFETLRLEFESDPAQTFRLIPALVDIGFYRSALVASTNLLRSAGLEGADSLQAPEFFTRVRFGAYYLDWVIPVAQSERISPLLLLSIIRQESTYEGFISSGAGALGLMQIMPDTGAQLADELEWPENYTLEDLKRPLVSLVFGASYLEKWRNYFDGDLFAMLAAYNGGPGNAIAWKDLTPTDDPDLFLEIIRIEETRSYIRLINEIHYIYRWLYGSSMDPF